MRALPRGSPAATPTAGLWRGVRGEWGEAPGAPAGGRGGRAPAPPRRSGAVHARGGLSPGLTSTSVVFRGPSGGSGLLNMRRDASASSTWATALLVAGAARGGAGAAARRAAAPPRRRCRAAAAPPPLIAAGARAADSRGLARLLARCIAPGGMRGGPRSQTSPAPLCVGMGWLEVTVRAQLAGERAWEWVARAARGAEERAALWRVPPSARRPPRPLRDEACAAEQRPLAPERAARALWGGEVLDDVFVQQTLRGRDQQRHLGGGTQAVG
jgi:hypothetical protein